MKKLIAPVLIGLSAFCIAYLLGSFVAVSFDIKQWSVGGRIAVAVITVILTLASLVVYCDVSDEL